MLRRLLGVGVTAAEKYAEPGLVRPVCCGEPQRWCKDTGCKAGGYWACSVKSNETQLTYRGKNRKILSARTRTRVQENIQAGLCGTCGKLPLATADGWMCNPCLDKRLTPLRLLEARRKMAQRRHKARATNHEGATSGTLPSEE